ncbi:hypothetical protein RGF97_00405 [Streptomyces roseicoloratus]|uniref:2-phosphosulfolactate phosphatase n=1 Tax=Streptomyces roseicoloratus TaxID=2508722 RepID=A0ABY9S5F6_9ACTN|nr:hypothetical protein [Streptomyces roseicoloratus]WMX49133.1 hypothetical protein RGF97_00405 [Streptomyces roseicoloratus]
MSDWFLQPEHGVRFEWGPTGARQMAQDAACLVVVDVLSFTTSVTVAVEAGTQVFPYAWRDETAVAFARNKAAALAVGRRAATSAAPWSLSPAALRNAPFTPGSCCPLPTDPPSPRQRAMRQWWRAVCVTPLPSDDGWPGTTTGPRNAPWW